MQDRRSFEIFARGGGAGKNKNSGTDNRTDAERRQRPLPQRFLQAMIGFFRLSDQLINGLPGKQLIGQQKLLVTQVGGPLNAKRQRPVPRIRSFTASTVRAPASSLCGSSIRAHIPWAS